MVWGGCRAVVMTLSDSARPCVGIKGLSCLAGGEADGSLRGIWLSFTREGRVCHRRAPCLVPTNCSLGFRLTEIKHNEYGRFGMAGEFALPSWRKKELYLKTKRDERFSSSRSNLQ